MTEYHKYLDPYDYDNQEGYSSKEGYSIGGVGDYYHTYKPIANYEDMYLLHDITISYPSKDVTEIRWYYKVGEIKNQHIHRISKNIPLNKATELCTKITKEWSKRLQEGEQLEDLYMESLL